MVQIIWEKYYSQSLPGSKMEGSSWWRSHLGLFEDYKSNSYCKLGNGQATLLWHNKWSEEPLKEIFPELLSFANNDILSVNDWTRTEDHTQLFNTLLSTQAYIQFARMQQLVQMDGNDQQDDS
jgi:hypothetical protein